MPVSTKSTSSSSKKTHTENGNGHRGRARKEGLRSPQIRILQALSKAKSPMTCSEIAAKSGVDPAWFTSYIGAQDELRMKELERIRGFKSLIALDYVRRERHDVEGRDTDLHQITVQGRKALQKALQAAEA